MKKLLILLPIVFALSCSYPTHVYESKSMIQEEVLIDFETKKEAIRVQRRFEKYCSEPRRLRSTLFLNKEQLECIRIVFGKEYSLIKFPA